LDDELPHDSPCAGAERQTHGGFALALHRPRHQERSEIADSQEQKHRGASLHE
jgi:hypothetical protein